MPTIQYKYSTKVHVIVSKGFGNLLTHNLICSSVPFNTWYTLCYGNNYHEYNHNIMHITTTSCT